MTTNPVYKLGLFSEFLIREIERGGIEDRFTTYSFFTYNEIISEIEKIKKIEDPRDRDFEVSYIIHTFLLNSYFRELKSFSSEEVSIIRQIFKEIDYSERMDRIINANLTGKFTKYPYMDIGLEELLIYNNFLNGIEPRTFVPRKNFDKKKGFVYLIHAENGLYKIGKTLDVEKRMIPFSVHFPMKWELDTVIETPDYHLLEIFLHDMFNYKQVIGEWFGLNEYEVALIRCLNVITT